MQAGSINPNLFQSQEYKYGSICNPSAEIRGNALAHLLDSVDIGRELGDKDVSLWIADGSNYPGTQSIRKRIEWMEEVLASTHAALGDHQRMLVEYKPFEPAFYHTDISDWGMALELSRRSGPKAKVLVDTGHHLQGTNIEQIVAWLLHCDALGGFHFNGKKEILRLTIEPTALGDTTGDVELLEDLITAAVNEAGRRADEAIKASVSGLMGGLNLPGIS